MVDAVADAPFADNADLLATLASVGNALVDWGQTARLSRDDDKNTGLAGGVIRDALDQRRQRIARAWEELERRGAATIRAARFMPWLHLGALFQLSRAESALLVLALLPELDPRYGMILCTIAGCPATPTGTRIPLAAARLLINAVDDPDGLRRALGAGSALMDWHIIDRFPSTDPSGGDETYGLSPPLTPYLLGQSVPHPCWSEPLEIVACNQSPDRIPLDTATHERVKTIQTLWNDGDSDIGGYVVLVQASDQDAGETLCAALFATLGLTSLRLDARAVRRDPDRMERRLRCLCRDALLANYALVVTDAHVLCAAGEDDRLTQVLDILMASHRHFGVVNGPQGRVIDQALRHRGHRVVPLALTLRRPDAAQRRSLWRDHAPREGMALSDAATDRLVAAYPFTETQIVTALKDAAARRLIDDQADAETLLTAACRAQAEREPLALAREVRTTYRLDDVVLPAATCETLRDVLLHARHRDRVMEEWGFAARTYAGRNLCVLFYGPPGTGKTMAASALANELGLGLYRIDLASVLSKYIGETEQHLAQLFDQAEAMNIVLFFDEAESLFARRTETHDAHDRHANLQTGYLLQRIESYPGIVILSTNMLKNIDPAFTRRFQFMIEYPFPGPEERLKLWHRVFPAETPLADDIDYDRLAEKATLTGGHIQSVAIAAALHASAGACAVRMDHVLSAVKREYEKLGKVFFAADFTESEED